MAATMVPPPPPGGRPAPPKQQPRPPPPPPRPPVAAAGGGSGNRGRPPPPPHKPKPPPPRGPSSHGAAAAKSGAAVAAASPKIAARSPPRPPPPPPPPRSNSGSKTSPRPPHGRPPPPPPKNKRSPAAAAAAQLSPATTSRSAGAAGRPPPPPPKLASGVKRKPPPPPPKRSPAVAAAAQQYSPMMTTPSPTATAAGAAAVVGSANNNKRPKHAHHHQVATAAQQQRRRRRDSVTIRAPTTLRVLDAFDIRHQVGEGTYGSVFVASDKRTREVVAFKKIKTEAETNGFPITAIREVKILKALHHVNIVDLKEIVTSKDRGEIPKDVYMVFEYLEYDLTGILDTPEIRLTQDHVKSWSQQLLSGVHYMHTNKVIHRDLKASNLLVNRKGELKIADLGLARSWNSEMRRLTQTVITLWYRPPELLLGCAHYTPKIDMWSVGCIIAEMFRRHGLLKGSTDQGQLGLIFNTVGHPTADNWPDVSKTCRLWNKMKPPADIPLLPNKLAEVLRAPLTPTRDRPVPLGTQQLKWITDNAVGLIGKLMTLDPAQRWSAEQALDADYFFENPIVKTCDKLNMKFGVDSVHEFEARAAAQKRHAARNANQHHRR